MVCIGAIGTVAACGGRSTAMSVRDGPQKSPEAQSPVTASGMQCTLMSMAAPCACRLLKDAETLGQVIHVSARDSRHVFR